MKEYLLCSFRTFITQALAQIAKNWRSSARRYGTDGQGRYGAHLLQITQLSFAAEAAVATNKNKGAGFGRSDPLAALYAVVFLLPKP